MPRRETEEELPHDLKERKELFKQALLLEHFAFATEPWRPPMIPDEDVKIRAVDTTANYTPTCEFAEERYEFGIPLQKYNLRLAAAATAAMPMLDELRIAGLKPPDLELWKACFQAASRVQADQFVMSPADEHLYVHPVTYVGEFTLDVPAEGWTSTRHRLQIARGLFERTAIALNRIIRTVSYQALLERLFVDRNGRRVELDGRCYANLTRNQSIFFHYLRLSGNDWLSSTLIERAEGISDFRVERCRATLAKKHPELDKLLVTEDGVGTRIVLPLPPG